jgi:hypothetical protein
MKGEQRRPQTLFLAEQRAAANAMVDTPIVIAVAVPSVTSAAIANRSSPTDENEYDVTVSLWRPNNFVVVCLFDFF